jgi:hypothetical protein
VSASVHGIALLIVMSLFILLTILLGFAIMLAFPLLLLCVLAFMLGIALSPLRGIPTCITA